MSTTPAKTLYLIDISSFIFRAYYAIRGPLSNSKGEPTNAIYGVAQMLLKLVDEAKPEHLVAVFDSKEPSFRKERYAEYKANRSAPPDDLIPQFDRIEQLVRAFRVPMVRQSGVEADDLIATLTDHWCRKDGAREVVIISSDKDLMQLVDARVILWDTLVNKRYGAAEVTEKFSVRPDQVRDYLALLGDSSDNIPGVVGFGAKTAADILKQFGTLEAALEAAARGEIAGKKGVALVEQKAMALLSQELATVKRDCPVNEDESHWDFRLQITPELLALLQELEFFSLLKKMQERGSSGGASAAPTAVAVAADAPMLAPAPGVNATVAESDHKFISVETEEAFAAVLEKIRTSTEFGFDLETTSLNPRSAEIVGVALSFDAREGYYIPIGHRTLEAQGRQLPAEEVLRRLQPYLENPLYKKIGQNLKYDFSVLYCQGMKPRGIGADTMVAAYVLDSEGRHNLAALALKYLGYPMLSYEEVCGKGKDQISFADVPIDLATRYSAEDAWIALKLWRLLQPRLVEEKLVPVFAQLDLPMVDLLCRMEMEGITLDVPFLKELSQRFGGELAQIEAKIATFTNGPVNLNSPKQLAVLLFEQLKLPTQSKTKTGFSTDASVLEALAPLHEVPRLLLEYREISKLKGTYVDPLPLMVDAKTGRVHAGFHQTVAATGRLSSSDPNLQNIPIRSERGKLIRRAFLPRQGNLLLSADYSQIELRLLAHMSGDRELVASFKRGEDVHRRTAAEIFAITPEQVSDEQRDVAKAINFGLMYGKTAFGLAQELGMSRKQAQETIDRYFVRYSGVKTFLDSLITGARENGFVTTLSGRKRWLRDIHNKNAAVRANAERMAMNTPIQGTAADLMKMAMIALDEAIIEHGLKSRIAIQVHDEVVLDCPEYEREQISALTQQAMESAMHLDVPLVANLAWGKNWMDL